MDEGWDERHTKLIAIKFLNRWQAIAEPQQELRHADIECSLAQMQTNLFIGSGQHVAAGGKLRDGMDRDSKNLFGEENASDGASYSQSQTVRSSQLPNAENSGLLRGAISIFILFNMLAIVSWAIPLNLMPLPQIKQIVRPYLLWTGLFQSWDFFAPNPLPINSYIQAVAITQDHHMRVFDFPRMEQLGYGKRYGEERYRKFAEVLCDSRYAALWPDVARHVASLLNRPTDPPQMVILMKFQAPIRFGVTPAQEPIPKPGFFYEYYVSGEDLR